MSEASIRSLSKTLVSAPKVIALATSTSQSLDLSTLLGADWAAGNTLTLECDAAFGYRLGTTAGTADLNCGQPKREPSL